MASIETDYLVVGAGASGMAFTDALIAEAMDVDVVMVDRRHRPGGHWNDAYPFVRLHQASAFYGVNSRRLGNDTIDENGPNAGFYEQASAAEICHYYDRVLEEQFLPSGRVRFFGMCDYLGDASGEHRFISRLTGEETTVRVRRRLVDATYLEGSVPATHRPSFEVDQKARVIPPNGLVRLTGSADGFTVVGGGKTAMDTCTWLLENGIDPDRIRWIKPREAWVLDRGYLQPLELVSSVIEGVARELESAARAENVDDLFLRLEECGQLIRLDPDVEPTMYRGATLSETERDRLRQIHDVVRLGRINCLGSEEIVLEKGIVPTEPGEVHVDCTAEGLGKTPPLPVFGTNRITIQAVRTGLTPFNAALIGFVESSPRSKADKNRLCPPNPYPNRASDWIRTTYLTTRAERAWSEEPDLVAWMERSRLNVSRGARDRREDPRMQTAFMRLLENREPALANLERFLADISPTPG